MPTNAELAARVQAAEDVVADLVGQVNEMREERSDMIEAVVQSLYLTRSQGAHQLANELQEKYGAVPQEIGDRITATGTLYTAGKGEVKP